MNALIKGITKVLDAVAMPSSKDGPVLALHWAMPTGPELRDAINDCAASLVAVKVEARLAQGMMEGRDRWRLRAREIGAVLDSGEQLSRSQLHELAGLAARAQEARHISQRPAAARSMATLGQAAGATLRDTAAGGVLHLDSEEARRALAVYVDLRAVSYDCWGTFHGLTFDCALWHALLTDERGRVPLDLFVDGDVLAQIERLIKTWAWGHETTLGSEGRRVRKRERVAFEQAFDIARSSLHAGSAIAA